MKDYDSFIQKVQKIMNYSMSSYNTMQQYAETHPDDPEMYRTFFLQSDTVAKKIHMRAVSNWINGEVPSTVRVANPKHLEKIKSGELF